MNESSGTNAVQFNSVQTHKLYFVIVIENQ